MQGEQGRNLKRYASEGDRSDEVLFVHHGRSLDSFLCHESWSLVSYLSGLPFLRHYEFKGRLFNLTLDAGIGIGRKRRPHR